jgi:hypothetical protein
MGGESTVESKGDIVDILGHKKLLWTYSSRTSTCDKLRLFVLARCFMCSH